MNRRLCGLSFLLCLIAGATTARAAGPIWQTYLEDKGPGQKARLYISPETKVVRGIIVDYGSPHGADRADYQAFAQAHDFAVLSTLLRWPPELKQNIEKIIADFAQQTGHPELVNVPWVNEAFSRSVNPAGELAQKNPDKVLAMMSGGLPNNPRDGATDTGKRMFIMNVIGSADPFVTGPEGVKDLKYFNEVWPKTREANMPWGCAIQWFAGHSHGTSMVMHAAALRDVINLRMPKDHDPRTGPTPLKDIPSTDAGWFGDIATWDQTMPAIAPAKDFKGDKTKAHWLPGSYSAHVWRSYVVKNVLNEVSVKTVSGGVELSLTQTAPRAPELVIYYDGDVEIGRGLKFVTSKLDKGLYCVYAIVQPAAGFADAAGSPYITRPLLVHNGKVIELGGQTAAPSQRPENLLEVSDAARPTLKALYERAAYSGPGNWVEKYSEDFSKDAGAWQLGTMGGKLEVVDGALQLEGEGQVYAHLPRDWPRDIAVTYRARNMLDAAEGKLGPNDICMYIGGAAGGLRPWRFGSAFHFGVNGNTRSAWQVNGETDAGDLVKFTPKQWHDVRIERINRTLTATVDGKPAATHIISDGEARELKTKTIGLYTVASRVQIDDVKVFIREPKDPADIKPALPTAEARAALTAELVALLDADFIEQRTLAEAALTEHIGPLKDALVAAAPNAGKRGTPVLEKMLKRR